MGPGRYLLCPPGAGARFPRADRPPAALCPAPGPWAPPRWTERAAGSLLCLQMGFWCPSPGGCVHPLLSAAFFSSPLLVLYCYESFQKRAGLAPGSAVSECCTGLHPLASQSSSLPGTLRFPRGPGKAGLDCGAESSPVVAWVRSDPCFLHA